MNEQDIGKTYRLSVEKTSSWYNGQKTLLHPVYPLQEQLAFTFVDSIFYEKGETAWVEN
jgi:hypothetical protein